MTTPSHHEHPHPITKPFFTFGTLTLLVLMGIGFAFGITRMLLGLGTVTNLDDHYPWGIWIAFDVACGVALAAGGFTTAALVDIFGRKKYHALLRPAILTSFLGYLWVAIALNFDVGRYWNMWRPVFNWQGNSVLFEVGMCVTFYLFVLSVEMSPAVLEGLKLRIEHNAWGAVLLRRVEKPIVVLYDAVRLLLPLFIVAGVMLSFMHQSSLGTLMLIAPTKLSSLWNTPILPLLFLLSAIMVGFPMVVLESIYASISLGRKPEMELLRPLARVIPWFIGLYGAVKLGDLACRYDQLNFLEHPAATISLVIEILVGIVAPFLLFLNKAVRRSAGWLFFTVLLIIFGVVLNRINVFLVGYTPAYATKVYFPSIGEIALSVAIVCSLLFCYRVAVTFFPVLPGQAADPDEPSMPPHEQVNPFWTWVIRGAGIACLVGFVGLYSLVHVEAIQASVRTVEAVQRLKAPQPAVAPGTAGPAYPQRPAAYKNFYLLNSPVVNVKTDDYEPVGFSHRIHDELAGGDCGVCHHRYSRAEGDRVGEDINVLHAAIDTKIGGPCSSCHDDMAQNPPQSCNRCHGMSNESDAPARIGLKGAYHRQCIGCHERQPKTVAAPTSCASCHHPWTPDHAALVTFAEKPTPQAVTRVCLSCHAKVGHDLMKTAHGMAGSPAYLECLTCHDTSGKYRKDLISGGQVGASPDLAAIAKEVGRPSRQTCGGCHFARGVDTAPRNTDLEPVLAEPQTPADMHMGTLNMRCQDCHTTVEHKIAGRPVKGLSTDSRVRCERCHGLTPHGVAGVLSRHLDDHIRAIACETCHIPSVAHIAPTVLSRDYATAGQDRTVTRDPNGMPEYDRKCGTLTWGKDVVPAYLWFDGTRTLSLAGDKIDPRAPVVLNAPVGEKRNPAARIFPFKVVSTKQPYDKENKVLAKFDLGNVNWTYFEWDKAIADGMKQANLPYSGKLAFVETRQYTSIHHEVVPAKKALGCTDCHSPEAVSCTRCHQNAKGMDLPAHRLAVYPEVKQRLDFKALGYPDDPARVGGRFYISIGRGAPPQ